MEFFDLLDCASGKTGNTISRDEAHRIGAWHGAFHCLIIYERDGLGYALFQKRSRMKKIAPGKFDVSVGGHYSAGEDAKTAGPREIREELGCMVPFEDLYPVGRRIFVYCFSEEVMEYEFQDVFLLPRAIRPEEFILQREELDSVFELEVNCGIDLFSGKIFIATGNLISTTGEIVRATVSAPDFVPCLDNYYLKLLLLARRYLNGERKHLVI